MARGEAFPEGVLGRVLSMESNAEPHSHFGEWCASVSRKVERISRTMRRRLCWAARVGREPVSLQHDGVLLRLWPHDNVVLVEQELSRLCSATLGYVQPVTHKAWD